MGKDGYTVVLNGIEDEIGAERVANLQLKELQLNIIGFDMTKDEAVTENITKIGEKYGKIDVLVNNTGGIGVRARFEEMTTEQYRFVMALNLRFSIFCIKSSNSFS